MELIKFIFSSFWIWLGFFLFLMVICESIVDCIQAICQKNRTIHTKVENKQQDDSKGGD